MKKFRIIFAVIALVAIFAAPAYADFFYLRDDTDTTVKVAPFIYPNVGMYDYPKNLVLNSTKEAPAFVGTFKLGYEYMMASNWDETQQCQLAYFYPYQYAAWGMSTGTPIPIPGSGKTPSDVACSGTLLYLANRGAEKTECGSVTVHNAQDENTPFALKAKIVFNQETLPEYLKDGDITHADQIFAYNDKIYVLLSVENNGTWKQNILVAIAYSDSSVEITQVVELDTKADGYATLVPYVDSSGYMLLAAGSIIEKVILEDPEKSKAIVTKGIAVEGWTGHFSHIARDTNNHTFIMCQASADSVVTTLVYKVNSTDFDAMEEGQVTGDPIYKVTGNLGDPFIMSDIASTSTVWIYLGEQNKVYRHEGSDGNKQGSENVTLGGDGYIVDEPASALYMANPSDTQIPDSGGGCNAGATAVMLAFCALPFFFRKKH